MNKLFLILVAVCMLFGCSKRKTSGDGIVSRFGESTQRQAQHGADAEPNGVSGPTVFLFGEGGGYPDNTLADFMYFVPLISPVPVSAVTSSNNTQGGHLLSYESDKTPDSFYVACEFRMKGLGSYLNKFDGDAMIEWNMTSAGNKKVLKNILNYIKFEGEGYGRIEAKGTIAGSVMTVDNVEVHFDARGAESPVTVGLYDVDVTKKKDGHYSGYNNKVARITTLTFNKSDGRPKMELKISAVGKSEDSLGTWEHIIGFLGNFFIDPIEIDKLGNETMLQFGLELYNKQPKFTFPKAKNLRTMN